MYLKTFKIKKFRSISDLELTFNKGINVIIGENSSGKTSIIDALRICLSIGKQWKDIGVRNDEDFNIDLNDIDKTLDPIEFDLHFAIESPEDAQLFASLLHQDAADPSSQDLQMHFRYAIETTPTGATKMKWRSWGGSIEGQPIDANEAQLLYFTYLAPLRNAEQELRPYAKDNKISSLFRDLTTYKIKQPDGSHADRALDHAAKNALAAKLESVIRDDDWLGLITTGAMHVNEHLDKADIRKKQSRVHLQLLEYKYENIVKGIVTRKPVYHPEILGAENQHLQRFFDVSQNGLGENNLIFASAVLGDLKNRRTEKKEHYYALLIEEPEAHLHPQRQTSFFTYLNNLQGLGVQVFITSHSPTLTAKSQLDNIIVVKHQSQSNRPFTTQYSELNDDNKSYLRKFLDVTKSQLFFSNGTLLVEGISEALLLPVFACLIDEELDLDKNGVEVVNVGGISFEAFAKLYNSVNEDSRLSSKCAILSDDDKGLLASTHLISEAAGITKAIAKTLMSKLVSLDAIDTSNRILYEQDQPLDLGDLDVHSAFVIGILNNRREQVSDRATNTQAFQSGNLQTHLASYTFEYELMVASELNYRLMLGLYKLMHPRTEFLAKSEPIKKRALEFVSKLDANKDKSEFAALLAQRLDARKGRTGFVVPQYIENAIRWVIPE